MRSRVFFMWLLLPSFMLLIATAAVSFFMIVPISMLTRDPLAVTGGHPLFGVISNLGALLWSFTVAICLFSYAVLKEKRKTSIARNFLLFGGLISFMLLVDDLFMLHDRIFPRYFNIDEVIAFSAYGSITLYYLWSYKSFIKKTAYIILFSSAAFFVCSLVVDFFLSGYFGNWRHLFEDGPKFLGIVCWFGYFSTVCFDELRIFEDIKATSKNLH